MVEHDGRRQPAEGGTGPDIDLGMVGTCDPERAHAAEEALQDVVARYHLDPTRLVSDLIAVLHRRFGVRDIRIGLDQWFAIGFRLGVTVPPVRGVIAADEVEHALVAMLRHLGRTPDGQVREHK